MGSKFMKYLKKVFVYILIVCSFLCIFNVDAFINEIGNYSELNSIISNDDATKSIVLTDDITIPDDTSITIKSGQNVTIDLNGHTISFKSTLASGFNAIVNNGNLTIKDSSDTNKDGTGTGSIYFIAENPDSKEKPTYVSNIMTNKGNFTLESGYLNNATPQGQSIKYRAVNGIDNSSNNSKITINGGKITTLSCGIRLFADSNLANDFEMNGGVIEGRWSVQLQAVSNILKSNIVINDGTLKSTEMALYIYDYTTASDINIEINGGNFIATEAEGYGFYLYSSLATTEINDGEFDADYPFYYYGVSKNENHVVINGGTFKGTIYSYQGFADNISNIKINGGNFSDDIYVYVYILDPYAYYVNTSIRFINGGNFANYGYDSYWGYYYANEKFIPTGKMTTLPEDYPYTLGYEVTLDSNYDETQNKVIYSLPDGKLSELPTLYREGYNLLGWNDKQDGSGSAFTSTSVISKNKVLYAQWEIIPGEKTVDVVSEDFKEIKVEEEEILDAVLTDEDKEKIDEGKDISVKLNIENLEDPTEQEKEQILKSVEEKNYEFGQYIDISLIKTIVDATGSESIPVTQTSRPIKITLSIPDDLINKNDKKIDRTYFIVRSHEGKVEYLATVFNAKDNTISFETDKFSVYSIAYKDTEIKNPKTFDDIYYYYIALSISTIALAALCIILTTKNQK